MTLGGWNAAGAFWTFCSNVCPRTICALYNNMCSSTQAALHRNRQLYVHAQRPSVLIFPQSTCLLPFVHCLFHHLSSISRTWSLQPRWTRCIHVGAIISLFRFWSCYSSPYRCPWLSRRSTSFWRLGFPTGLKPNSHLI